MIKKIKLNRDLLLFDKYLSKLNSDHYFNGSPQVIYSDDYGNEIMHINYTEDHIGIIMNNLPSYFKDIKIEFLYNSVKELTNIFDYKICDISE